MAHFPNSQPTFWVHCFLPIGLVNSFSTGHVVTARSYGTDEPIGLAESTSSCSMAYSVALTFLLLAGTHLQLRFYFITFILSTSYSVLHRLNSTCSIISLLMSFGETVMALCLVQNIILFCFNSSEYTFTQFLSMTLLVCMNMGVLQCLLIPKLLRFSNLCVCLNLEFGVGYFSKCLSCANMNTTTDISWIIFKVLKRDLT